MGTFTYTSPGAGSYTNPNQSAYERMYASAMARLEGTGAQAKADVRQEYGGQLSKSLQGLVDRGLMATTIAPSIRAGYTREMQNSLNRVDEALLQQWLQSQGQYASGLLSAGEGAANRKLSYSQLQAQQAQAAQQLAIQYAQLDQQSNLASRRMPVSYNQGGYGGYGGYGAVMGTSGPAFSSLTSGNRAYERLNPGYAGGPNTRDRINSSSYR